jgi:hypothetical protein
MAKQSPAGFTQSRNVTTHGGFPKLVATKTEFSVDPMRTPCQPTTPLQPYWTGVTGQFLQLKLGFAALLIGGTRTPDKLFEFGPLGCVFFQQMSTFELTINHTLFGHRASTFNF